MTGVDISMQNIMIAESTRSTLSFAQRLTFIVADYYEHQFQGFDLIISDSALHLIDAQTELLFEKIYCELVGGGMLIFTIPYDCLYNHALWTIRRIFRALRCSALDKAIYSLAKRIHKGQFTDDILKERINYMYLLPNCFYNETLLHLFLTKLKLTLIHEDFIPHASLAQPKHKLVVFKKL